MQRPLQLLLLCLLPPLAVAGCPPEWAADAASASLLHVDDDSAERHMPAVGNGFLSTPVDGDSRPLPNL